MSRRAQGFGGSSSALASLGGAGGALLLLNALSSKISDLIEETSRTLLKGYESGGLVGILRSKDFRALLKRYAYLATVAFAFERLARLWSFINLLGRATHYLYIDANLKPGDQAYDEVLSLWEHHPSFRKRARSFQVETGTKASKKRRAAQAMGHIDNIYGPSSLTPNKEEDSQTRLSPNENAEQWLWFHGNLFRLRRWTTLTTNSSSGWGWNSSGTSETSFISIRSYGFTRRPLFELLKEAKRIHERTKPEMVTLRVLDGRGSWRKVAYRHRRPLSSVIMDAEKRATLLQDAKEFLRSEAWYNARGIPWKRGYLLHGAPGTGKSSTIQALASEVQLDVYIISLQSSSMNDASLTAAMRSIPPRSIVCMEDVDVSLSTGKRALSAPGINRRPGPAAGWNMEASMGSTPQLSLSSLLNAIDGVEANEGRLLIMTTNALSTLDPALVRPGRVDLFIEYKRATSAQAKELFNLFYTPSSRLSAPEEPARTTLLSEEEKTTQALPFDLPSSISVQDIRQCAEDWAAHVEDEVFTIAELQGMLLGFKKDPHGAARAMPDWVRGELALREESEARDSEKEIELKKEKDGGQDK